jgi:hypothetical protein
MNHPLVDFEDLCSPQSTTMCAHDIYATMILVVFLF